MQNHPSRKKTPIAAFRIAAAGLPALAQDAATRPNRPIRRIANFPSSGSVHVIARTVEQKLSEAFNQPVLVDNRTGTRGNIGTAVDGYTLPATPPGPMTVNQNLYKNMPLDPARMAPVVRTSSVPNAITARPDFPFDFVGDPMNHIKAANRSGGSVTRPIRARRHMDRMAMERRRTSRARWSPPCSAATWSTCRSRAMAWR